MPHLRACLTASLPELISGTEGLVLCDGENQQEALPAAKIIIPDSSVVLLASCVQDVDLDFLPVQHYLLPVAICLSGFVVFDKLRRRTLRQFIFLRFEDCMCVCTRIQNTRFKQPVNLFTLSGSSHNIQYVFFGFYGSHQHNVMYFTD